MKKLSVLLMLCLMGGLVASGCSDSSSSSKASLENYSTGTTSSVPAVLPGEGKTTYPASADTHEVETDGKWIVWKGRQINLSYYDGTTLSGIDTGLGENITPWSFGDCNDSFIAFDGTKLYFLADNVADADGYSLYSLVPGSNAVKLDDLDLSVSLDDVNIKLVVNDGIVSVVTRYDYYTGTWNYVNDLYVLDTADEAPALELVATSDNTSSYYLWDFTRVAGGYMRAGYYTTGGLNIVNLTTGTVSHYDADGDSGTNPDFIETSNGIFTWVENGNLYYLDPAAMTDAALVQDSGNTINYSYAGPDYFIWRDSADSLYYIDFADIPGTPELVTDDAPDMYDLLLTEDAIYFIDSDEDSAEQLYMAAINPGADPLISAPVQLTDNDPDTDIPNSGSGLSTDGVNVYAKFYNSYWHNPSDVTIAYDTTDGTITELTSGDEFQKVSMICAAGGKAVIIHRDHSFRLFAKNSFSSGKPVAITPQSFNVENFDVAGGIVTFQSLDRQIYLSNPALNQMMVDNDIDGEDLMEIYFLDLNSGGPIIRVTNNLLQDSKPQTDGVKITWYDDDDYCWAYDIAAGEMDTIGYGNGDKVSVSGNIATWRDGNVIYHDFTTGETTDLGQYTNYCPTTEDGIIAFGYNYNVYYYDTTAETPEIINVYEGKGVTHNFSGQVITDGEYLTWEDTITAWDDDGDSGTPALTAWDHDGDPATAPVSGNVVMAYNISTGKFIAVPVADTDYVYDLCRPRLSDGLVVFAAEEYGVENPDSDKEIFYCDITADTPTLVRVTNDPEGEGLWDSKPQVTDGLIVWRTGGASNWEWDGKVPAAARVY